MVAYNSCVCVFPFLTLDERLRDGHLADHGGGGAVVGVGVGVGVGGSVVVVGGGVAVEGGVLAVVVLLLVGGRGRHGWIWECELDFE